MLKREHGIASNPFHLTSLYVEIAPKINILAENVQFVAKKIVGPLKG